MRRLQTFLPGALLTVAVLTAIALVLGQVYDLGFKQALGWLIASALLVGVILVALWWQSLPYILRRFGRYSFFDPVRNRRRARLLQQPFPDSWIVHLRRNVAIYNLLGPDEQAKLRDDLRVLIAEKRWEGRGGLEITDEIKLSVAAQASILLLGLDHEYFDAVPAIVMYPGGFTVPQEDMGRDGVIHNAAVLGQAWYRGPVILAWDRVLFEGRSLHPRSNVVYHEFAHQLDFTGDIDESTARSASLRRDHADFISTYRQVMREEYDSLVRASHEGTATLLDHYGATNHREFFAVATECFFTQSRAMLEQHPRLYEVLSRYYNQDPAAREAHALVIAES
jgi:Mlc titration factor MtfA (ptsG expression regulator)